MNTVNRSIPAKGELQPGPRQSGQRLQPLFDDALQKIEPFFNTHEAENSSTRIYRVMESLHGNYPHLNQGELEALLMGLLKHRGAGLGGT